MVGPFPDHDAYYGVEAVAAYTRAMLEPMRHVTMEAEEMIEAGDSVLVGVRQQAIGRASGVPTEARYFTLCRMSILQITSAGRARVAIRRRAWPP
jgi:hypothetical protein